MTMQGLMPTVELGNGSGSELGGAALGGFGGALVGSWFGNGWGGGLGGRGGECHAGAIGDTAVLDSINAVGSSVQSGNMALCQGFGGLNSTVQGSANATQMAVMNAAGGVGTAVNSVNNTVQNGHASLQSTLCQGFSGLNTAIMGASKDNALLTCQSTNAITSSIDNCCCVTQKTIMAEACATRELIKDVQTQNLRDQLCDAKAQIAQAQTLNAVNCTTDSKIAAATNTIISHMHAILAPTPAHARV